MSVFEAVKTAVSIMDVAAHYGVEVNRHGKALCFAHSEKTPSLSFRRERFRCFGCGVRGDVLDLVCVLRELEPLAAAQELNDIYKLGLFPDKPLNPTERKQAQAAHSKRKHDSARLQRFDEWERWVANTIVAYLCRMDEWKQAFAPRSADDNFHPLFVEACHNLDKWEYLYGAVFVDGNFADKVRFYEDYGKAVTELARRLNESREVEAA